MATSDSLTKKGKQVIYSISSDDDEESITEDEDGEDDEDEEEGDSSMEEGEEEDEVDSGEGGEEDGERKEEEYDSENFDEDEYFEPDQEGGEESDEDFDEDEDNDVVSEDQSSDDVLGEGDLGEKGKLTDEELCKRVIDLLLRNQNLDVLKLKECKAYLRKHELRISGSKAACIQRILLHWRLKDGNGERLYPKSSFIINCTGDVCKGDVVMFKQRVYEKFNKASKRGELIGKRTIAGRVVKESYGGAKHQHTFTVEVLWSKGVKPLRTLSPLLVKGRNLYRYKTHRQRWSNEADRSTVLKEKHTRGDIARHLRAAAKSRKGAGSRRCRSSLGSRQQHGTRLTKRSEATQEISSAKTRNRCCNKKHAARSSSATHSKKHVRNATPGADFKKLKAKMSSETPLRQGSKRRRNPSSSRQCQNKQLKKHSKAFSPKGQQEASRNKAASSYRNHKTTTYSHIHLNRVAHYGHVPSLIGVPHHDMNQGSHISRTYAGYGFQVDPRVHANYIPHPHSAFISQNAPRSTGHIFRSVFHDNSFPGLQFYGSRPL